jgi:hypothetical protein
MEMQVNLRRPFDRLPGGRERPGGPHHLRLGKGRRRGAGRVQPWAASPPGQQSPHTDCTYTDGNPGHDHQHMGQFTHGLPRRARRVSPPARRPRAPVPRCRGRGMSPGRMQAGPSPTRRCPVTAPPPDGQASCSVAAVQHHQHWRHDHRLASNFAGAMSRTHLRAAPPLPASLGRIVVAHLSVHEHVDGLCKKAASLCTRRKMLGIALPNALMPALSPGRTPFTYCA